MFTSGIGVVIFCFVLFLLLLFLMLMLRIFFKSSLNTKRPDNFDADICSTFNS